MGEVTISVKIADRPYTLVIEKGHEELFNQAMMLIEKRMKDYSGSYAYKDKQDLLAMVALEYATSYLRKEETVCREEADYGQQLVKIDALLTEFLNDKTNSFFDKTTIYPH